jgi:hypothetical protein
VRLLAVKVLSINQALLHSSDPVNSDPLGPQLSHNRLSLRFRIRRRKMLHDDIISPAVPDIQNNDIGARGHGTIQSREDASRCVAVNALVGDSNVRRFELARVRFACRDAMATNDAVAEGYDMNFSPDDCRTEPMQHLP